MPQFNIRRKDILVSIQESTVGLHIPEEKGARYFPLQITFSPTKPTYEHPVMERLNQALQEFEPIYERYKQACEEIAPLVYELRQVWEQDEELFKTIISHLYWYDLLPMEVLDHILLLEDDYTNDRYNISPAILSSTCTQCHQPYELIVKNKQQLRWRLIINECQPCREAICQQSWEPTRHAIQERLDELHTMPYTEYLQTPEWKEKRQAALERAEGRCQLCNTRQRSLHVHHRTYKNRGYEEESDLITLCATCHAKFHDKLESGKEERS